MWKKLIFIGLVVIFSSSIANAGLWDDFLGLFSGSGSSLILTPQLNISTISPSWRNIKCTGLECSFYSVSFNSTHAILTPKSKAYFNSTDWAVASKMNISVSDYKTKGKVYPTIIINSTGSGANTKVYSIIVPILTYNRLLIGNSTIEYVKQNESLAMFSSEAYGYNCSKQLQKWNGIEYVIAPQDIFINSTNPDYLKVGWIDYNPYNTTIGALNLYREITSCTTEIIDSDIDYILEDSYVYSNIRGTKRLEQRRQLVDEQCNNSYASCNYEYQSNVRINIFYSQTLADGTVLIDPSFVYNFYNTVNEIDFMPNSYYTEDSYFGLRLATSLALYNFNNLDYVPQRSSAVTTRVNDFSRYDNNFSYTEQIHPWYAGKINNAINLTGSITYFANGTDSIGVLNTTVTVWINPSSSTLNKQVIIDNAKYSLWYNLSNNICYSNNITNTSIALCTDADSIIPNTWNQVGLLRYAIGASDRLNSSLGAELIVNGDMELNANWTYNRSTPLISNQSFQQNHSGYASWKLVGDSLYDGASYNINTSFAVSTGRVYRLGGWVYVTQGSAYMILANLTANTSLCNTSQVGATSTWTYLECNGTTVSTKMGIFLMSNTSGATTAYFDDVSLMQWFPTYYSNNVSLYINGKLNVSGYAGNISGGSVGMVVGNNNNVTPTRNFAGSIDELNIYRDILNPEQMDWIYQNESNGIRQSFLNINWSYWFDNNRTPNGGISYVIDDEGIPTTFNRPLLARGYTYDTAPYYYSTGSYDNSGYFRFDGLNSTFITTTLKDSFLKEMTISSWIRPENKTQILTNLSRIIDSGISSGFAFQINHTSNEYNFIVNNIIAKGCNYNSTVSNWTNLIGTLNITEMILYVNGQECGRANTTQFTALEMSAITFGKTSGALTNFYNGSLDEVNLYQYAFSSSDVASYYNSLRNGTDKFGVYAEQGLIRSFVVGNFYPVNYTISYSQADTFTDRNGLVNRNNDINVSDNNIVTYFKLDNNYTEHFNKLVNINGSSPENITGISSSALRLKGASLINTSINGSVTVGLASSRNGTVSIWVNPYLTSSTNFTFFNLNSKCGLTNNIIQHSFYLDTSNRPAYYNFKSTFQNCNATNTSSFGYSTTVVPLNAWSHIAYVFNSKGNEIYVNGINTSLVGFSTMPFLNITFNYSALEAKIGNGMNHLNNRYFNGGVDELLVFNRSLDSSEVMQIYKSGLSRIADTNISIRYRTADNYNLSNPNIIFHFGLNENITLIGGASASKGYIYSSIPSYFSSRIRANCGTCPTLDEDGVIGTSYLFTTQQFTTQTNLSGMFNLELQEGTMTAWVRGYGTGNIFTISDASSNFYIDMDINASGFPGINQKANDAVDATYGGFNISDNMWHFISIGVNTSYPKSYILTIDGVRQSLHTTGNTGHWFKDTPYLERILIGGASNNNIDEVTLYNKTLNNDEIKQIYYAEGALIDWGTWSDFQYVTDGQRIDTNQTDRFIQYEAKFQTSSTNVSPYLLVQNFNVSYDPYMITQCKTFNSAIDNNNNFYFGNDIYYSGTEICMTATNTNGIKINMMSYDLKGDSNAAGGANDLGLICGVGACHNFEIKNGTIRDFGQSSYGLGGINIRNSDNVSINNILFTGQSGGVYDIWLYNCKNVNMTNVFFNSSICRLSNNVGSTGITRINNCTFLALNDYTTYGTLDLQQYDYSNGNELDINNSYIKELFGSNANVNISNSNIIHYRTDGHNGYWNNNNIFNYTSSGSGGMTKRLQIINSLFNYSINTNILLSIGNSYGLIDFYGGINGTGSDKDFIISNKFVYVNVTQNQWLNSSANITFYVNNVLNYTMFYDTTNACTDITNPSCFNFTSTAVLVIFNVSYWSKNFSIDTTTSYTLPILFVYSPTNNTCQTAYLSPYIDVVLASTNTILNYSYSFNNDGTNYSLSGNETIFINGWNIQRNITFWTIDDLGGYSNQINTSFYIGSTINCTPFTFSYTPSNVNAKLVISNGTTGETYAWQDNNGSWYFNKTAYFYGNKSAYFSGCVCDSLGCTGTCS